MQKSFKINSSSLAYDLIIGGNLQFILSNLDKNLIILVDEILLTKFPEVIKASSKIIPIKAEESSKDLSNIPSIINKIKNFATKKGDILVGIGGGIIQDITCFIASIYMRGVDWIYFPTTYLGMCDSCIGGKSSINVGGIKNLVGNFYPPKQVIIDYSFIETLDQVQIDCGICEAMKICFAKNDNQILKIFYDTIINRNQDFLQKVIELSLDTKKFFIEIDEFDLKERKLLNFGHSFGHAIEGASAYEIPHGIAVGFGMVWALNFSKLLNPQIVDNYRFKILFELLKDLLLKYNSMHKKIISASANELLIFFKTDKKHQKNQLNCILLDEHANLKLSSFLDDEKFQILFKNSFEELKNFS